MTPSLGFKGITPINLYRAGFFDGSGNLTNAQFGKHIWLRTDYAEMWRETQRILEESSSLKYFDLAASFLGSHGAELLAKRGECIERPNRSPRKRAFTQPGDSPSKRMRYSKLSGDEDDVYDQRYSY